MDSMNGCRLKGIRWLTGLEIDFVVKMFCVNGLAGNPGMRVDGPDCR